MRKLTSIRHLSEKDIYGLLDFADQLKVRFHRGLNYKPLTGKTVITSFPPTSLRTRISYETGINQLGGQSINLQVEFNDHEILEDRMKYLNNWVDFLVIRHPEQELIEKISNYARFGVVNAMSKKYHPCEILGDAQSIRERRGELKNLKFVYVGMASNIGNSWFELAAKLDLNMTQICVPGYEVEKEIFENAKANSKGDILIEHDLEKGIDGADIILTDSWMKIDNQEDLALWEGYRLTLENLKRANKSCLVNPCPPFIRGQEISAEVIQSDYFIGYKCKENLMHIQKAVLSSINNRIIGY